MIESRAVGQFDGASGGSGLGVISAKYQAIDSRLHECPYAHCARLERHVQGRVAQPVVALSTARGAQRDNLGMSAGVDITNRLILAGREDLITDRDDGPDRYFASFSGFFRFT